jgi:hypothetical protein
MELQNQILEKCGLQMLQESQASHSSMKVNADVLGPLYSIPGI